MKHMPPILLAISLMLGVASSSAQTSNSYENAYRTRIEKINARIERKRIEADCKAAAKKTYSAIRWKKYRALVKECVAKKIAQ